MIALPALACTTGSERNVRSASIRAGAGSVCCPCGACPARRRTSPSGTVRIIVPFAAGGPTDVVMRILAEQLTGRWNSPVLVENRPGAGTILATAVVAKAQPDGHTLGVSTNSYVINPAIGAKVPYDTLKDFANVTHGRHAAASCWWRIRRFRPTRSPSWSSTRRTPRRPLNFASPGPRGSAHLAGELLKYRAGIDMTHINYKGSAAALPDVVSGRVPLLFDIWHSAKPYVDRQAAQGHRHRQPRSACPNCRTCRPSRKPVPGVSAIAFQALFAPAGTPQAVLDKIAADVRAVISSEARSPTRPSRSA